MSKKLLYISGSVLALVLVASATTFAATNSTPTKTALVTRPSAAHSLMVTLTSVSGTTLTVTARGNNAAVTTVDASNAKIEIGGATGSVSGLKAGDRLIALGVLNGTTFTATRIMDGSGMTSSRGRGLVSGVVTAVTGSTITVSENQHTRVAGKNTTSTVSVVVTTDSKTMFSVPGIKKATIADLKVGAKVSIINGSTNGSSARLVNVMPTFVKKIK